MNPVRLFRAAWILPMVSPPVPDGAVAVAEDRVIGVGPARELTARFADAVEIDLGKRILLPGLTNAHTHLGLTCLPHPPPAGTPAMAWLETVARAAPSLTETDIRTSVRAGIRESAGYGTVLVGDIAPGAAVAEELAGMDPPPGPEGSAGLPLAARVFFEFLGVGGSAAVDRYRTALEAVTALAGSGVGGHIRPGLSPHAPYSVPEPLWFDTGDIVRSLDLRYATHLGELPGEKEFLLTGTGPILDFFNSLGVWDGSFPVPGTGGVAMLERRRALDARALLVHGIHLTGEEIERVASSGAWVCLCPRSNAYLGLPPPPVEALVQAGVPLCLGTDSRASNESLSVWAEMRAVSRLVPGLSPARIVDMATLAGARALGMEDAAGSIRPGAAARLISVPSSGLGNGDPLEFLVHETLDREVIPL